MAVVAASTLALSACSAAGLDAPSSGLALGLWLSVATLAAALVFLSHRLGQLRERQLQQASLAQAASLAAAAAVQAQTRLTEAARAAAEGREGQARAEGTLDEVLRAAALPMLLCTEVEGQGPTGSVVSRWNPAALALWPELRAGQPLQALLQQLQAGTGPATDNRGPVQDEPGPQERKDHTSVGGRLCAALRTLGPGDSLECGGWRLVCLPSATSLAQAEAPSAPPLPPPPTSRPVSLLLAASGAGWAASAGVPQAVAPAASAAGTAAGAAAEGSSSTTPASEAGTGESDHFSFTLSHDLRAPIRVVEGFTRIVKEDYGRLLDRVGNDHLDRVLGAAARMNLMIDALLTLARLSSQPLARQPVNLTQLAHYVVDDLRRQHPERTAQVEVDQGLAAVGDPTLLRLVLENLLGNAWKYSARSASTHIEFRREMVDGRPAFVVRDQGAGFDMRSADRLFGLFQRLHSANDFPGTGVGLASVRRIVRRHGGEIWAEAEPGRGASFHFTLAH